jgi:hypothetical protein
LAGIVPSGWTLTVNCSGTDSYSVVYPGAETETFNVRVLEYIPGGKFVAIFDSEALPAELEHPVFMRTSIKPINSPARAKDFFIIASLFVNLLSIPLLLVYNITLVPNSPRAKK